MINFQILFSPFYEEYFGISLYFMASFDSSISNVNIKVKVILLGDTAVGKSSIIASIRHVPFRYQHEPTVGIDFFSKILVGTKNQYKLQFWDTAGQERFKSILPSYIRNTQIGVVVYDVGNRSSFENIENWIQIFNQYAPLDASVIIIANKIDITHRQISQQEGKRKASELGALYIELSAKTKEGINRFNSIALHILESTTYENDLKTNELISRTKNDKTIKIQFEKMFAEKNHQCCYI